MSLDMTAQASNLHFHQLHRGTLMNEKLEVAKLATQLIVALIGEQGAINRIALAAKQSGADKNAPEALLAFDAVFKHLQDSLGVQ